MCTFAVLATLIAPFASPAIPEQASANHTAIKFPFASGATWRVLQGYNASPAAGGSHYNCNTTTLKDEPSGTTSCSRYYQYKYSIDLVRADGNTSGQAVLSPVDGVVRWTDPSTGGISIDLGDGWAFAFFHVNLLWSRLPAGAPIAQGQLLGQVAPSGTMNNGGTPHIHITLWQTSDGGNWSRIAAPFTGDHTIDGFDFPATATNTTMRNQSVTSTNVQTSGTPATPTPAATASATAPGGSPGLTLDLTSGKVGSTVQATATGFNGSETVRFYWDNTSSSPLAAATAANGTAATALVIPNATTGQHTVYAVGGTSGRQASTTFTVRPYLTRTPIQGPVGTSIDLTVTGFGPNEQVRVNWETTTGPVIATLNTDATGTGSTSFPMPEGATGQHDYTGFGLTSGARAWGALFIERSVTTSPANGAAGTQVTVTAHGFPAAAAVTVAWNKTSTFAGTTVCTGTTSSKGLYSCTFAVPSGTLAGVYPVAVTTDSGTVGQASIVVGGSTAVSVSPTSGRPGTLITINGGGFSGSERVNLSWDGGATWYSVVASGGNFRVPMTVPNKSQGVHTLTARGATSGLADSTAFTITTSGDTGSTMVSNGVFSIIATREGLVGGTTSSGHVITPNDHFVSLPGCVASNCNWLTPGQWSATNGYVTNCGSNCYVKITHPTTGKCSVGKVLDWGPWFQNDNWWEPNGNRSLNALASNPNYLDQGYPATDAIYAGMDVGYGPARPYNPNWPSYGNRAAADLGDGIWRDIGYADGAGPMPVIATMLWQTGESAAAAIASCGGTTTSPTATATATKTPTAATATPTKTPAATTPTPTKTPAVATPTPTTPANCVPGGTATLHINDRARVTTPLNLRPSCSTATSVITVLATNTTVTVLGGPYTAGGYTWYRVQTTYGTIGFVAGQFLALEATPTPTATPAAKPVLKLDRSRGSAGRTLTATLQGFGPNETVQLRWDHFSTIVTIKTDANGKATTKLKAPPTNGRQILRAKGLTSAKSAVAAYTVVQVVTVSPNTGGAGDAVIIRGSGWVAGSAVSVRWNQTGTSTGIAICGRTASSTGTFSCKFTIPGPVAPAVYPIVATSGSLKATANFTVNVAGLVAAEVRPTSTPAPSSTASPSPVPTSTATPTAIATATEIVATATPSELAETPTEVPPPPTGTPVPPTETPVPPTATPEPIPRELAFLPIADTSVAAATPAAAQPIDARTALPAGGSDGNVVLMTFAIEGIGPGTVVEVKLVLTSAGNSGGGTIGILPGVAVDEGATYAALPVSGVPAIGPVWLDAGAVTSLDLTGVVTGDGLVTFVLSGTADSAFAIASRESDTPPVLSLTVVDPPGS